MDCNVFDSVLECIDYLDMASGDALVSKADLVDSMRMRMSIMVGKCVMQGPCFVQPVQGWRIERSARWE